MKRRIGWPYIVALAVAANAGVFAYRPRGLSQLGLVMSLLVVIGAGCVYAARSTVRWPQRLLVIGSLIVAMPLGAVVGHRIRDYDFQFRRRAHYQAIVDQIVTRKIDVSEQPIPLSVEPTLALWGVRASHGDGITRVEFFWGRGFPVRHTAYIYTSTGIPTDGAWDHWRYRRVADNWFEASD